MYEYVSNLRKNERFELWLWHYWRRIAAYDGDDLVAVHLQTRMETHHDIVCEYTKRILEEHLNFNLRNY